MYLKIFVFSLIVFAAKYAETSSKIPILSFEHKNDSTLKFQNSNTFIPFNILMGQNNDITEFWRETEILSLVRKKEMNINYDKCRTIKRRESKLHIPSRRLIRPICRSTIDFQQCPQCPRLTNFTECELFRDSCKERRVLPSEYQTYCDQKYGKWRTKFFAADYSQCQCCDECVYYRELDQSCEADEYSFDTDELLPTSTIERRVLPSEYQTYCDQKYGKWRTKFFAADYSQCQCCDECVYYRELDQSCEADEYSFDTDELLPTSTIERRVLPSEYQTYCDQKYGKWRTKFFAADYSQCQCCDECVYYRELDQSCEADEYSFDTDELLPTSTIERRVLPSEYQTYCDQKYGKWRTKFFAADYSQCQCCDECVYYRELDQSCEADEYSFDTDELLPTSTIDFRAGCNPYLDHAEQELRALRCDNIFRRCVPASTPSLPNETLYRRHNYRYESIADVPDCPISCRGFVCQDGFVKEQDCVLGSFRPDKTQCNCCGKCSAYFQLNKKCAELKKTVHKVNGTKEIEVEEEFLDPGCDDGLVCRDGVCQDIHGLDASASGRRAAENSAYEPCREQLRYFIKKYGKDGHLHYDAPQCTPLWLYAPVQCRRFVCYCALEDGTFVEGIKVPRAEVSNMNCDCAREKCRTGSDFPCDGYGNYAGVQFSLGTRDLFVDETK